MTSLAGSLFLYGNAREIPNIERYDEALNQWSLFGQRPGGVYSALVSHGDSIYFIGGVGAEGEQSGSLSKFDPASSEWTELQSMYEVRCPIAAEVAGSNIFVVGCMDDICTEPPCFQCYDICNDIWTKLSAPILNRETSALAAHHFDEFIYLVGDNYSDLDNGKYIEKYDISRDRWHVVEMKGMSERSVEGSALVHVK